ncbi:CLUMA_CG006157, isoform A [Clunio marinus]|uniref:CLUMA_CG006157, isoform A n=1 Tax=Clunio marinus TaxID=568069 RepID=A0A1J1I2J8_9DIPT|nr:CLUMA_CG006157, isoform A [Clunio marinus]
MEQFLNALFMFMFVYEIASLVMVISVINRKVNIPFRYVESFRQTMFKPIKQPILSFVLNVHHRFSILKLNQPEPNKYFHTNMQFLSLNHEPCFMFAATL